LIDVHSHVLYGLDDGARTLEDSVAMVRLAAEHGTTDLVATPHANLEYKFEPELIAERIAEIKAATSGCGLTLHTGCDFHLSYDNVQDAVTNPRKYTVDHKNYLLVEFSDLLIFHNTPEILGRLLDAGMIPVITHPERNGLLRQRIEEIAKWVEEGSRVQVTGQSLLGGFGKRAHEFSKELLDRDMVHVIASDAHDCEHRPPLLDLAYAWLERHYGEALAHALCVENPGMVLRGEPMASPKRKSGASSRKWYHFWR
jgi:protein-tyrosine phosphatase